MQRMSFLVPDATRRRIKLIAKDMRKTEAEVIREAIEVGLEIIYSSRHKAWF